jgi:DNA repair exonuclease SbcCD ATPase subunit
MENDNIDNIKKDLTAIKLKIEELEKGVDSFGINNRQESAGPKNLIGQGVSFEEKRKEIENEIEKSEKRLELISERKKRIESMKKEIEKQEGEAKTPEERRKAEQQRRIVEDERNRIEEERNKKEAELKVMKLQLKEWDKFYFEKNAWNTDFEKSLETVVLEEEKQNLLIDLQKIETRASDLKELLHDTSSQREVINKKLSEIVAEEKSVEKEIRTIEDKAASGLPEEETRKLEKERKIAEEKRRFVEQTRWEIEDELQKIENVYSQIKAEYGVLPGDIANVKKKLEIVNHKLDTDGKKNA